MDDKVRLAVLERALVQMLKPARTCQSQWSSNSWSGSKVIRINKSDLADVELLGRDGDSDPDLRG